MKSLYLDIGNTFLKMARKKNAGWEIVFEGQIEKLEELSDSIQAINNSNEMLVTSVRKDVTQWLRECFPNLSITEYKASDIPSKMLDYNTPETLGLDRFLVCLGASKETKNKGLVVIDVGSACTVDLMNEMGVYQGGVIMPGLNLVQQAMEKKLPELPIVPGVIPKTWPGKSTVESIEWGVNGGFVMAIRGFIHEYRKRNENPDIYVTGGDAEKLIGWIGEDEKLIHRKHLIWEGMEEFERLLTSEH